MIRARLGGVFQMADQVAYGCPSYHLPVEYWSSSPNNNVAYCLSVASSSGYDVSKGPDIGPKYWVDSSFCRDNYRANVHYVRCLKE